MHFQPKLITKFCRGKVTHHTSSRPRRLRHRAFAAYTAAHFICPHKNNSWLRRCEKEKMMLKRGVQGRIVGYSMSARPLRPVSIGVCYEDNGIPHFSTILYYGKFGLFFLTSQINAYGPDKRVNFHFLVQGLQAYLPADFRRRIFLLY